MDTITLINTPRPAVALTAHVETIPVQRDPLLIGSSIRVSDAATRYKLPQSTLTRWADRGLLHVLRRAPGVLELDEADVALVSGLYRRLCEHTSTQQAGRWLNELLTN